jgi:hypothetical protein
VPDRSVAQLAEYRLAQRRCAIERMGKEPSAPKGILPGIKLA